MINILKQGSFAKVIIQFRDVKTFIIVSTKIMMWHYPNEPRAKNPIIKNIFVYGFNLEWGVIKSDKTRRVVA